jgi:hypothetical protein
MARTPCRDWWWAAPLSALTDAPIFAVDACGKQGCDAGEPLRAVKMNILEPMYDDYFYLITDWYGVADLTSATAAKLDWAGLSADSAWAVYDGAVVRQDYAPFQI